MNNIYKNKYYKYKDKYIQLKSSLIQYGGKNLIYPNKITNILKNIIPNSYSIFELNYSDKNKKTIQDIKINKNIYYDFYGSIGDFISNPDSYTELTNYLVEIGDNEIKTTNSFVKIIKNLAKTLSIGYDKEFFWLTVRSVMPNEEYIIPRWHCDGNYFNTEKYTDPQTKFVTIFKGPGTLLIEKNNDIQQIYNNYIMNKSKPPSHTIDGRINIDKELKDAGSKIIQLNNEQGLIFLSGFMDYCAIHSEPNITEPRIFLSIVFADEKNINEWKDKRKKK